MLLVYIRSTGLQKIYEETQVWAEKQILVVRWELERASEFKFGDKNAWLKREI